MIRGKVTTQDLLDSVLGIVDQQERDRLQPAELKTLIRAAFGQYVDAHLQRLDQEMDAMVVT